jgi:cytochrome d ubiquinol oxidase subunit I
MDAVFLARIQFAVTVGFHFIFPPTTLGFALIILILETMYRRGKGEVYKQISTMLIKLLGLVFVLGTATGVVMEFAFGNNWAEYSRMVGDIFGAPLAAEAIFAFFLESVFLGVLLFGRNRVSGRVYWWSAFFVFFGSHLSGLWIIIANSWMQTPAGYALVEGKAVLTDFWAAVANPSTLNRYLHTIIGSWITGSLLAAAVGAWYLLKKKWLEHSKILLRISLLVFIASSLIQLGSGHSSAIQVAKTQPEKMASFEALWQTQDGAPMSLIGLPDEAARKTRFEIRVPKLLSLLIYGDLNARVLGLDAFPDDEKPPLLMTYMSYHVMITLGFLFIAMALLGIYFLIKKTVYTMTWYLWLLILTTPLAYVALETGWMAAEIGRQPWVVYKVMRTVDAVSKVVPAGQILFTLIVFGIIYSLLFWIFVKIFAKIVRKGPEIPAPDGY